MSLSWVDMFGLKATWSDTMNTVLEVQISNLLFNKPFNYSKPQLHSFSIASIIVVVKIE